MRTKDKKEIEYPDAPSGFVMLYNYKEPFMPFKTDDGGGFGYQGVLLFDGEEDKVQCHFCGVWLHALGNHIQKEHSMNASDYKKIVGLAQSTALISETLRAKLIANGQERFKNIRPRQKKTEEEKKKISETMKAIGDLREYQNLRNTCPAQLLDRLKRKAQELGRCPTNREISCIGTLSKVFGSFREACLIAGLTPLKQYENRPGYGRYKNSRQKEFFLPVVQEYWIKNGKFPRMKDFSKNEWRSYVRVREEIKKTILGQDYIPEEVKKGAIRIYTDEELMQEIRNFIKVNSRNPSWSDFKRNLLPEYGQYRRRFGGLKSTLAMVQHK